MEKPTKHKQRRHHSILLNPLLSAQGISGKGCQLEHPSSLLYITFKGGEMLSLKFHSGVNQRGAVSSLTRSQGEELE